MAANIFPILILNGRPAAGKSEIIDYLKKTPVDERIRRFHVGEFEEFDDFPILWERFEDDDLWEKHGRPRLASEKTFVYQGKRYEGYVFRDPFFWNWLIEKLNLAYSRRLRDIPKYHERMTALFEFARGTQHGGFAEAYRYLSDEVLERASTLYIKVSWEESLRKNRRRKNPDKPDSILEHSLEDIKMEYLYKESEWDSFSAPDPEYLHVGGRKVPYAVFDNEPEKTDDPEKLGPHLEAVLGRLWSLHRSLRPLRRVIMENLVTLAGIILAVALFTRASGNPLGHGGRYLNRRILNWVPLGVGYAFLYFGRYNLTVAKNALGDLMTKPEFGTIFSAGTFTYAFAFVFNGPLTDRIGGRKAMLLSTTGAAVSNILLGLLVYSLRAGQVGSGLFSGMGRTFLLGDGHALLVVLFCVLYALNMYFQSFGAVSIVKVNSSWFHVRERGVFGGIFGILISAGIFFAFDFGQWIVDGLHTTKSLDGAVAISPPFWVFWIPALLLLGATLWTFLVVRDRPAEAGFADFDTGDASSGEDDAPDPLRVILRKVVTNPVVLTIGAIELCTGVIRQGVMQWYTIYGKEMGYQHTFVVTNHWGTVLFLAGSAGGMLAGWISDKVFGSRRGPVAALLYSLMFFCILGMAFSVQVPGTGMPVDVVRMWVLGLSAVLISFCVIGTHGMLSGTATMDFGGRKNAGTAVGLIDGLVYLGTGIQALSLGFLTEKSWTWWPPFLIPFVIVGTLLALKIWKAMPQRAAAPAQRRVAGR